MKAPSRNPVRQKRHYSVEQKGTALALLKANGHNVLRTARELGIPRHTLRDWAINHRGVTPEVVQYQHQKERTLAEKLEENAHRLADSLATHDLTGVSLASKATALGIVTDKALLLRGQPTSISGSVMSDDERRLRLAELLAKAEERRHLISSGSGA